MIADQLRRRYQLTMPPAPGIRPLNPAAVVRWYSTQEQPMRVALDEAEPLTWTKHLTEHMPGARLPWHLTAHIAETFVRSQNLRGGETPMMTIPENTALSAPPSLHGSPVVTPPTRHSLSLAYPPFNAPRSRPHSILSLEPSLARRRSHDDLVSFEPRVDSARASLAGVVRRFADGGASPRSSRSSLLPIASPASLEPPPASPSSSRFGFSDYARRIRARKNRKDSDAGSSRNSLVEDARSSASEDVRSDGESGRHGGRRAQRPGDIELPGHKGLGNDSSESRVASGNANDEGDPDAPTAKAEDFAQGNGETTSRPKLKPTRSNTSPVTSGQDRAPILRKIRRSLPSSAAQVITGELEKRRNAADEQKEQAEYEIKAK